MGDTVREECFPRRVERQGGVVGVGVVAEASAEAREMAVRGIPARGQRRRHQERGSPGSESGAVARKSRFYAAFASGLVAFHYFSIWKFDLDLWFLIESLYILFFVHYICSGYLLLTLYS